MGSSSDQRTALAQTLITIERFMRERGLDYQRAARAAGIDPAVAKAPEARVPLHSLAQLLDNVARETNNDALGAQIGATFRLGTTGTLDYVISNAPTLRVALHDYARFMALVSDGLDVRLEEHPRMSYIVTPLPAAFGPGAQLMDAQTAVRVARIRRIMRDPSFPLAVELTRAKPRAVSEFKRIFGRGVRFARAENRIGIATRALDKPLPAADPQLYRILVQAAKKALADSQRSIHPTSRVISHISANLPHGDVKISAAARTVGLSPPQLRRQLAEAGTTFRRLLDETRKSMAAHYINETQLAMTEIAFLLGFSELSAFSRAAKKWFGRTPRDLRRRSRTRR